MRIPQRAADWVPDWASSAVFYHIYPLGFLDAPSHNDRRNESVPRLRGLLDWLDHIAGLGVTALYLGPVFESRSHGYDTVDYFRIDRRLGDNALFSEVVDALHARGMRVILDGVFNHTSREFFAFKDIRELGRASKYHDWYHINWGGDSAYGDGFAYESWEGHQSLPTLNIDNPDVRNYIFEIAKMWLGDVGIDGWRLDVAYELPTTFLWELRRECKAVREDCFLLGELVHGDYRSWVARDLLDAGTNYQLHEPLLRSFNESNFADVQASMERAWHSEWGVYKDTPLVNFLSNHDVTRIWSNLDDPYHVFAATILLLTAPGIPMLYYGDAIGMQGRKAEGDSALRRPMPPPDQWPEFGHDLYRETAQLVRLRLAHPSLHYGRFVALHAAPTSYAYLRQHVRETAVIALNAGEAPITLTLRLGERGIRDGTVFRDVLNPEMGVAEVAGGRLRVADVPARWGRILISSG